MPMPSTMSWLAMTCWEKRWNAIWSDCISFIFLRVSRSVASAISISTTAEPVANMPIQGWITQMISRKTGAQGASKSGAIWAEPR